MNEITKSNCDEIISNIFNTNNKFSYTFYSKGVDDTKYLGETFAKYLKRGTVIALNGELGSGKTLFLTGVGTYFNIADDICSPTFTIVNEYTISKDFPLYHFDVYRIKDSDEFIESIGVDYFSSGACLIEWADTVISDILPQDTIHIDIDKNDKDVNSRNFRIWRN